LLRQQRMLFDVLSDVSVGSPRRMWHQRPIASTCLVSDTNKTATPSCPNRDPCRNRIAADATRRPN